MQCPKFIDWDARKYIEYTSDMIFLKSYHQEPRFFTDISRGIWQGMTVTYVALQIAYYMGFRTSNFDWCRSFVYNKRHSP